MKGLGALFALAFAAVAAIRPEHSAWLFFAVALAFELWLMRRVRPGAAPVAPNTAPYGFSEEEAALVGRYRFHFVSPALARECAGTLAAVGLASLVLVPWLVYRSEGFAAAAIGANLFLVARLTQAVSPHFALKAAARGGERNALRALEIYDSAWEKVRAGNALRAAGAPPG